MRSVALLALCGLAIAGCGQKAVERLAGDDICQAMDKGDKVDVWKGKELWHETKLQNDTCSLVDDPARTVAIEKSNLAYEEKEKREEQHRHDLWWALRTRALSDKEMAEVKRYGEGVAVDGEAYFPSHELEMEFDTALFHQTEMRRVCKP